MPFLERDETSIFFETMGAGEPVLLLHGFAETGESQWKEFIPSLSQKYRLIIPDFRGHGRSVLKRSIETDYYEKSAEDMVTLLEEQGSPSVVCGFSLGGIIGCIMAAKYPELIKGLVVIGGSINWDRAVLQGFDKGFQWVLDATGDLEEVASKYGWKSSRKRRMKRYQASLDGIHKGVDWRSTLGDYVRMARSLAGSGWSLKSWIEKIRCPTLVIQGDRDYQPVEEAVDIFNALSVEKKELFIVPGSGHAAHRKRPDLFLKAFEEFYNNLEERK